MPEETNIDFIHHHSAHCESGSTANLLRHFGLEISEPLAFGIGAGLFFGYFPFFKIQGLPLVTFRSAPGRIIKNNALQLGMDIKSRKFKDPEKAMDALDELLDKGIPAMVQTGVYWLPYFPDALRFHFNAHNIIIYGKKDNDYLISDPVFETPVTCNREDLNKARFAEGMLAPKGNMHYLRKVSGENDFAKAIKNGIMNVCRVMINVPLPVMGVNGIEFLARQLRVWPKKYGKRKATLYLAHVIRMQEEIGTGGGGFRLMYAAFLQESGHILNKDSLLEVSGRMTKTGDTWRQFAAIGARICKNRPLEGEDFNLLSEIIMDCAGKERQMYKGLKEEFK